MRSDQERNEIAAFVLEEVHRCWLRADFEHALKTAIQNIREFPPPATTAGKVELYRNNRFHDDAGWLDNYVRDTAAEAVVEAARNLLKGCESLDREQAILPQQMQAVRRALSAFDRGVNNV
jgi:hypothetical protein